MTTRVIKLNREALQALCCDKAMTLVPGATHLFEEPGTLEEVMDLAGTGSRPGSASVPPVSGCVGDAGRRDADGRLQAAAEPLPDIDDAAFAGAFDRYADARVVLLGEASHGTSEFYRARAAITRHLVEQHGFDIVAVEADWPDAAAIDRHVRLAPHRKMAMPPFSRFPTWMWRNTDVEAFVR